MKVRTLLVGVAAVATALAINAPGGAAQAATQHVISGLVLGDTGKPLAGATVKITEDANDFSVTTGSDGRWQRTVPDLDDWEYVVEFSAPGYLPEPGGRYYVSGYDVTGVDGQLVKPASISGVVTKGGKPLSHPYVRLHAVYSGQDDGVEPDSSGHFRFDNLTPDVYGLDFEDGISPVTHTGYHQSGYSSETLFITSGEHLVLDNQAVPYQPSTASVVIKEANSAAIESHVAIYLADQPLHSVWDSTVSSEHPAVSAKGIYPGLYKIAIGDNAWYGGRTFERAKVYRLTAGTTTTISATVPNQTPLAAQVVNERGEPLNGIDVEVYRPDHPTERVASTATPDNSGNGRYEFVGLPVGDYRAKFTDPSGEYLTRTIDTTALTHQVVLKRANPFPPPVTGAATASVSGALHFPRVPDTICFHPANGDTTPANTICTRADSAKYSVPAMRPGSYRVELRPQPDAVNRIWYGGRTFASATTVTIGAGQHKVLDFGTLPDQGELAGAVVDESGIEVPNITVIAYAADNNAERIVIDTSTTTGYRLSDLPVGAYKLRFIDGTGRYSSTYYGGSSFATAKAVTPRIGHLTLTPAVTMRQPLSVVSRPIIYGTERYGSTLTASHGQWSKGGLTYTRQWYRSGKAISHATHSTYKLTSADVGHTISVKVTARTSGGTKLSSTSSSTGTITRH